MTIHMGIDYPDYLDFPEPAMLFDDEKEWDRFKAALTTRTSKPFITASTPMGTNWFYRKYQEQKPKI